MDPTLPTLDMRKSATAQALTSDKGRQKASKTSMILKSNIKYLQLADHDIGSACTLLIKLSLRRVLQTAVVVDRGG